MEKEDSLPEGLKNALKDWVSYTSPPDCFNCVNFDISVFKCKHDVPKRMEIYFEGELCCPKYKPE